MDSASLLASATVEIGLLSYRSVKAHGRGPLPSELLSVVGVWGILSVFGGPLPEAMAAVGWGLVVATALPLFSDLDPLKGAGFGLTPQDRADEAQPVKSNLPPAVPSKKA